jgi:hypothetical protein
MIVVNCQPQLLQVVFALSPPSGFTSLLNRWQQKRHQDRNDRDHNQ